MLFVNIKFPMFLVLQGSFSRGRRNEGLSSVARELSASLLILCSYNLFKKKSTCGYCSKEMLDDNLKQHCKEVHGKGKLSEKPNNVDFQYNSRRTSKKN